MPGLIDGSCPDGFISVELESNVAIDVASHVVYQNEVWYTDNGRPDKRNAWGVEKN